MTEDMKMTEDVNMTEDDMNTIVTGLQAITINHHARDIQEGNHDENEQLSEEEDPVPTDDPEEYKSWVNFLISDRFYF